MKVSVLLKGPAHGARGNMFSLGPKQAEGPKNPSPRNPDVKSRLPPLHTSAALFLPVPSGENKAGTSHARWSPAQCGAKVSGALQVRKAGCGAQRGLKVFEGCSG